MPARARHFPKDCSSSHSMGKILHFPLLPQALTLSKVVDQYTVCRQFDVLSNRQKITDLVLHPLVFAKGTDSSSI